MMFEWVQTIGHLVVSWPMVAAIVLVLFRRQIQMILAQFAEASGSRLSVGPLKVELGKLAEDGRTAVNRVNQISEVMAESRLLELEITEQTFGRVFTDEQRSRMQKQIETLRCLTTSSPSSPRAGSTRTKG